MPLILRLYSIVLMQDIKAEMCEYFPKTGAGIQQKRTWYKSPMQSHLHKNYFVDKRLAVACHFLPQIRLRRMHLDVSIAQNHLSGWSGQKKERKVIFPTVLLAWLSGAPDRFGYLTGAVRSSLFSRELWKSQVQGLSESSPTPLPPSDSAQKLCEWHFVSLGSAFSLEKGVGKHIRHLHPNVLSVPFLINFLN